MALLAAVVMTSMAARAADTAPATAPNVPAATAPATGPAAGAAEAADVQLKAKLMGLLKQIHDVVKDPQDLLDATKRAALAPEATPLLHKVIAALTEVDVLHPESAAARRDGRYQMLTFLVVLGDAAGTKELDTAVASKDKDEALSAQCAQTSANWLLANKDAAAQKKLLDGMEVLAKANPRNDSLAKTLMMMSNFAAADKDNAQRATDIITANLKGEMAQDIQKFLAQKKEMDAAEGNLKALENKPLTIAGKTIDGKDFTSADWKGKVILVDFWATWCGPCRGELPHVKKLYADYHAKGLEIVGVSCDNGPDDLTNFLKEDGGMPWPQVFDKDNPGWSPIAKKLGISGIPTMFVIDKAGVVRSVEGREKANELVPQLLDEKGASK